MRILDTCILTMNLHHNFQVKRHVVSEKYSAQIDEMYQHEEISSMW